MAFTFLAMILGLGFTSYKNDLLQQELNSKSITTHFGFINIGGHSDQSSKGDSPKTLILLKNG